jgi:hypothetical protein
MGSINSGRSEAGTDLWYPDRVIATAERMFDNCFVTSAYVSDDRVADDLDADDLDAEYARAEAAVAATRRAAQACAIADAALMATVIALADTVEEDRFQPDQIALVLGWSRVHALSELTWGRNLVAYLPMVWACWQAGELDRYRAWIFANTLLTLFDERPQAAAEIAARVLPDAGGMSCARLRQKLRRLLIKTDADAIAKRVRMTTQERHVYLTPGAESGTAGLGASHLSAERAAAAFERVDAIARARRLDGDARTLEQLRADTFCDLLEGVEIGVSPVARPGTVELTIPLATAAGLSDEPGELAGYGPVVADVARQIASARRDGQWRYSVTQNGELVYHGISRARPEPAAIASGAPESTTTAAPTAVTGKASTTGPLADHQSGRSASAAAAFAAAGGRGEGTDIPRSPAAGDTAAINPRVGPRPLRPHTPCPPLERDPRRRLPGARLRRWIASRDRICQAPACNAPARVCDVDHVVDHARGGPTAHANLVLLCRRHHRAKHLGFLTPIMVRPGSVLWISKTGQAYWSDQ